MDDYKREYDRVNALASELTRDGIVFRIQPPSPSPDDPEGKYGIISWHFDQDGRRHGDCDVFTDPATDEWIREAVAQRLAIADETRAKLAAMTPEEHAEVDAAILATVPREFRRVKNEPPHEPWSDNPEADRGRAESAA